MKMKSKYLSSLNINNTGDFGKKYKTVISLTDRSDMKYPMLIGRKFLSERFLVDVSQEYLTKAK